MKWFNLLFSKIFNLLPRGLFIFLGKVIGWIWFDLLRIRRQVVLDNIRKCFPEKTEAEVVNVGRRSMESLGINIIDVFSLPYLNQKWVDKNVECQGLEHLRGALNGKGAFCLGLHLGSGDLGIASLNYHDIKVNLITKRIKNEVINNFWFGARRFHGTRLIEDRRSTFDILKALKRNESVIFVLDQFMGPPLGVPVHFFGRKTGAAMGLALLVEKTRVPVIPCYSYVNEKGKIVDVFEPEIPFQDFGSREETIEKMTQIYTDKIEEIVRQYPEQWMWVHKRWKEFKH